MLGWGKIDTCLGKPITDSSLGESDSAAVFNSLYSKLDELKSKPRKAPDLY